MRPESIFRPEALEHHRRGLGPGELIRLSPVWTTWAFAVLLVLVVGLIVTSAVVTIEDRAEAPAVFNLDQRIAIALFPASYAGDIETGDTMTIEQQSGSPLTLTVDSVGEALPPNSPEVRLVLGPALASGQSQVLIPVHARLSDNTTVGGDEPLRAVVRFEETLLSAILPALGDLFGGPGG